METQAYMAIDQYGETYHIGYAKSPRQWLLTHFNRQSAQKMYVDTKSGKTRHDGYIIAGHWLTIYRVENWKQAS